MEVCSCRDSMKTEGSQFWGLFFCAFVTYEASHLLGALWVLFALDITTMFRHSLA